MPSNRVTSKLVALAMVAVCGSVFGIGLTIIGYLTDWGPGGSMQGTFLSILFVGGSSTLTGVTIGIWTTRKLLQIGIQGRNSPMKSALWQSFVVLTGSMIAFITSWEAGFFTGKISGAIEGIDWKATLIYAPLMAAIYGIPLCSFAAVLQGVVTYFSSIKQRT